MQKVAQAIAAPGKTAQVNLLPPITFALIALVLVVVYRKSVCLLLPLACVALALVWTFGLMALTKIPISMLTMIVPVFLIAVGTAYCLHIMSEYLAQAPESATPREAARKTFTAVTFPTVLAVVTTAIGLASLLVNRIPTIREFALFACFGIFSFLTILLTFLPAVIALLPLPRNGSPKRRPPSRKPSRPSRWPTVTQVMPARAKTAPS